MRAHQDDKEYETCEESFAPGKASAKRGRQGTTAISSDWHVEKTPIAQAEVPNRNRGIRNYRTFDTAPEKAGLGQKRSTKPPARRLSSRGIKALANRVSSRENIPRAVEAKADPEPKASISSADSSSPFATFISKHLPTSSDGSAEESAGNVGLYMAESKASVPVSKENDKASHSAAPKKQTLRPATRCSSHLPTSQGQNKSDKAVRVHSGNIPIIYVEDDMKRLLPVEEIDQKQMRLVAA